MTHSEGALPLHDALRALQASAAERGRGWTALHAAVEADRADAVEFLLAHGMPPDARTVDGSTPLHVAARHGRHAIARTLLRAGARIDDRDHLERSPESLAAEAGHADLAAMLRASRPIPP